MPILTIQKAWGAGFPAKGMVTASDAKYKTLLSMKNLKYNIIFACPFAPPEMLKKIRSEIIIHSVLSSILAKYI